MPDKLVPSNPPVAATSNQAQVTTVSSEEGATSSTGVNVANPSPQTQVITINTPGTQRMDDMGWMWELLHLTEHTVYDVGIDESSVRRRIDRIRRDNPHLKVKATSVWDHRHKSVDEDDIIVKPDLMFESRVSAYSKKPSKVGVKKEKVSDGRVEKPNAERKKSKYAPKCDAGDPEKSVRKEPPKDDDEGDGHNILKRTTFNLQFVAAN